MYMLIYYYNPLHIATCYAPWSQVRGVESYASWIGTATRAGEARAFGRHGGRAGRLLHLHERPRDHSERAARATRACVSAGVGLCGRDQGALVRGALPRGHARGVRQHERHHRHVSRHVPAERAGRGNGHLPWPREDRPAQEAVRERGRHPDRARRRPDARHGAPKGGAAPGRVPQAGRVQRPQRGQRVQQPRARQGHRGHELLLPYRPRSRPGRHGPVPEGQPLLQRGGVHL